MNPELQKTDASVTIHGRKSSLMDLFEGNTNVKNSFSADFLSAARDKIEAESFHQIFNS